MPTITAEEAQARLLDLLGELAPGDEVIITHMGKTVGRILAPELPKGIPVYGRGRGKVLQVSDDDEILNDFAEYLE